MMNVTIEELEKAFRELIKKYHLNFHFAIIKGRRCIEIQGALENQIYVKTYEMDEYVAFEILQEKIEEDIEVARKKRIEAKLSKEKKLSKYN